MDRISLIAELRASALNQRAALDNTLRLIRMLEGQNGRHDTTQPMVPLAQEQRRPFRRGRPRNTARQQEVRDALAAKEPVAEICGRLAVSESYVYRIKREIPSILEPEPTVLLGLPKTEPEPAPSADEAFAERTAKRITEYIERHGPTPYSPLIQALDITPREFNEAAPHLAKVEKIDGLWQITPTLETTRGWT